MIITISINLTNNCTRFNNNDVVADHNACSHVWGISGNSDVIGLSYGPIGIVGHLGSGGGAEESSWNKGNVAWIWGGQHSDLVH